MVLKMLFYNGICFAVTTAVWLLGDIFYVWAECDCFIARKFNGALLGTVNSTVPSLDGVW